MVAMRGLRACPVCPKCGSKKFRRIGEDGKMIIVECMKCTKRMKI